MRIPPVPGDRIGAFTGARIYESQGWRESADSLDCAVLLATLEAPRFDDLRS